MTYTCKFANQEETFPTRKDALACAEAHRTEGGAVYKDGAFDVAPAPLTEFSASLLREAKTVCDYVRDNEFSYGNAPVNPAVNHDAKIVSCDRFVGWVLYRLGYTDQPTVQGLCVAGPGLTNWCIDHGFTRISSVAELEPGDICFQRPLPPAGCPAHTYIFAGNSDTPDEYWRYDCGRVERIRSTQPSREMITDFMYAYRPLPVHDFIEPNLSFLYDGVPFSELDVTVRRGNDEIVYTLPDGIELTCSLRRFPEERLVWWVNSWRNPTDHPGGIISELWDCDVTVPFEYDITPDRRHRYSTWEHETFRVFRTNGSNAGEDDWHATDVRMWNGETQEFSTMGGRSCHGTAPFFDINRQDFGVLLAVGWTGQWHVRIDKSEHAARIRSGLEYCKFRLLPGEQIRTTSTAMLMYFRGQDEAHNRFRRFVSRISPIGNQPCNYTQSPFSAIFWGGVTTDQLINRWSEIFKHKLPFDTCWIDAGWYEPLSVMGMAEQMRSWPQIGYWEVSRAYHPDGYRDVVEYLKQNGVGFMVWFEPERVKKSVREWVKTLKNPDGDTDAVVVALNLDEVCDALIEMVSRKVDELSLKVYRQDYNIAPIGYWVANDEPDRVGMTEIRYVMNLYRFWDTLRQRHPGLLIDNCSSGGLRIDIETLSRSVPLWRSDYQCKWDSCPEVNQVHNAGAAWWMPYSGIGFGPTLGDTYAFRSAYANGLTVRTWEHSDAEWEVGGMNEPLDWAKQYFDEFVEIRGYFAKDYYPLIRKSLDNTGWAASQYHDPETNTGIVLAFRRAESPFATARLKLGGLRQYSRYCFTNRDTGEEFTVPGYVLTAQGADFTLPSPRSSGLWTYRLV